MSVYDVSGEGVLNDYPKQTLKVLVASSEADDSIKDSADYVCPGTNDGRES